jgi:uncharacterized protein YjiS (DUF1127 family)
MAHSATLTAGGFSFSGIVSSLRTWRDARIDAARRAEVYRRTLNELGAMTDNDLADIGIARFMIADIAADEAARA